MSIPINCFLLIWKPATPGCVSGEYIDNGVNPKAVIWDFQQRKKRDL